MRIAEVVLSFHRFFEATRGRQAEFGHSNPLARSFQWGATPKRKAVCHIIRCYYSWLFQIVLWYVYVRQKVESSPQMNRLSQLTSALVRMVCPWLATGAGFVGLGAAQGNADVRCEWKYQGICEEQIVRFLCGLARTLDLGWSWHATIIVIIAPWLSLTGSLPLPQLDSRYEPQKLRKAIWYEPYGIMINKYC